MASSVPAPRAASPGHHAATLSGELEQLRAYVEQLVGREGQPAAAGHLPEGGYEALPAGPPPVR